MCRTSHTSYAFSRIEMHRRENKEGFLSKLWWTSHRLLQCSQCKQSFSSISHTYVQQKLAIDSKIYLHQKGSHTTCLKNIKTQYRFVRMLFTIRKAKGTNKPHKQRSRGWKYMLTPTSPQPAARQSIRRYRRSSSKETSQSFKQPHHQQKEERNRSSQVRKPQPEKQRKPGGGTEEKIGPTVVVSEQKTSRPRNDQRTFLLDSHHDDKQQSFFPNDRYLAMFDSFSVSLKQQK